MTEPVKLVWRNVSPSIEKLLCDIRDNRVVGSVRLKGNWWTANCFENLRAAGMISACGVFAEEENAKLAVVSRATFNNDTIIVEEPEVLLNTYEKALRNIVCCDGLAGEIARQVLANPGKWELLGDRSDAEESDI